MAGRVDFKVSSFDDLIEKHGYYLTHYHALRCPCLTPETGQPDPNCIYCDNGWQYYGSEQIQGIITGVTTEKQFLDTGGMLIGTMNLTVKAAVELGYHDRIVNEKSVVAYSELLTRGLTATDSARFPVLDIVRIIGAGGVVYAPLTDYSVSTSKKIEWVTGRGPTVGAYYSVSYRMHPSWLVLSAMNLIRDTHIKFRNPVPEHHRLPVRALCKLEYLMDN